MPNWDFGHLYAAAQLPALTALKLMIHIYSILHYKTTLKSKVLHFDNRNFLLSTTQIVQIRQIAGFPSFEGKLAYSASHFSVFAIPTLANVYKHRLPAQVRRLSL